MGRWRIRTEQHGRVRFTVELWAEDGRGRVVMFGHVRRCDVLAESMHNCDVWEGQGKPPQRSPLRQRDSLVGGSADSR